MPFCPSCGKETDTAYVFCPYCGKKMGAPSTAFSGEWVTEGEFKSFIGKDAGYYWRKFQNFRSTGQEGFAFTWSWPAFFLGFIWMLYRKMYLWSLLAFIIALTPITFPVLMIGWGLTGNYLYFWHARKKILDQRSKLRSGFSTQGLAESGGVNRWVWFVGAILLLFLLAIGFLGGLFFFYLIREMLFYVPQFMET
ncbi:MAG: zinc-ribbon domain-containing protein [Thermodesulfobacteriota bacterium]